MNQTNTFICTPASPCGEADGPTCRNTQTQGRDTLPSTTMETMRQCHPNACGHVQFRFISRTSNATRLKTWPLDRPAKDAEIHATISALNDAGFDAYVTTQISNEPKDDAVSNADVDQLSTLFIDFDLATESKPDRPTSKEEALFFLRDELSIAPTMVLDSGGGLQAMFAIETPFPITDDHSRLRATKFAKAFQQFVHSEAQTKHGWTGFDNVADLARVHRVPFTTNWKSGVRAECRPLWSSGITHDFDALGTLVSTNAHDTQEVSAPQRRIASIEAAIERAGRDWFLAESAARKSAKASHPAANPEAIALGCPFLGYTIDNAETLTNPEWHAQLSILARTHDGERLCHEISSEYVGYSREETEQKIREALAAPGPYSIEAIEEKIGFSGYGSSPFYGRLACPLELGTRPTDQIRLLLDYAYVARTDEFVNLRRCETEGVKAETFKRLHAHLELFVAPDKSILDDPLCQKADERTYMPGHSFGIMQMDNGKRLLNIYKAPMHDAEPCSPTIFFDHIAFLIPDEQERAVFVQWLAHLVQRPWEKIAYSVALIGGQGTGKTYLLEVMKVVLGVSNVHVARGGSLMSQFDGHLAGKVMLGLEEVTITGRMEVYERLKTLITNEIDQFQRKNVNFETLQTPRGVLVLSNDAYALTLPEDDRRFFVIQTAAAPHPDGRAYYERLFDITPALAAGIYNALCSVDLSGFDPKRPPFATKAKTRMIEYSRPEIDTLVSTLMKDGDVPFDRNLAPWGEVLDAIRVRSMERVSDKRIRKALEDAGAHFDDQDRQARLKSRKRVRFVFFCDPVNYANHSAQELAREYEGSSVARNVDAMSAAFTPTANNTSHSTH